jgi:hypothetical protein
MLIGCHAPHSAACFAATREINAAISERQEPQFVPACKAVAIKAMSMGKKHEKRRR